MQSEFGPESLLRLVRRSGTSNCVAPTDLSATAFHPLCGARLPSYIRATVVAMRFIPRPSAASSTCAFETIEDPQSTAADLFRIGGGEVWPEHASDVCKPNAE